MFSLLFPLLLGVLSESVKVDGGNILMILPVPSPSHFVWQKVLIHGLAARGHNVTVLSVDVEKQAPPNVHYLEMEGIYEMLYSGDPEFDLMEMSKFGPFEALLSFTTFGPMISEHLVQSSGFNKLLTYPTDFKWDIVINDHVGGSSALGIVSHFNYPPLVSATAFFIPAFTTDYVHKHYAYVPHFILKHDFDMTFFQRMFNMLIYILEELIYHYYAMPVMDKIAREAVGENMRYLGDIEQDTILSLINADPAINIVEPMPPNVISVGGLQITEPKPVASDIEAFINKGKKGAILFSLGSNMRSDILGDERLIVIMETMRHIPDYNFIWKFESVNLPVTLPPNVMIKEWLSQNDILAHKKIKLFVTHCGMLSTQEATWHAVPMVGIPCFADQHFNLARSISAGVAEGVSLHEMTTRDLKEAILKVLRNPSYQENSKIRSMNFKDKPEPPLDRAIWWIEYVMRNPKPNHIRLPTSRLGAFRANHVDIILFVMVVPFAILYIAVKLVKTVCWAAKKRKDKTKKKTN